MSGTSSAGAGMSRNGLYLVIALLVVAVAIGGYRIYADQQKSTAIEIKVGPDGMTIESY